MTVCLPSDERVLNDFCDLPQLSRLTSKSEAHLGGNGRTNAKVNPDCLDALELKAFSHFLPRCCQLWILLWKLNHFPGSLRIRSSKPRRGTVMNAEADKS